MRTRLFTLLLGLFAWGPTMAYGQWYASLDFITPARSDAVDAVFQRNQEEILDANGDPTGAFAIGSTTVLSNDDLKLGLAPGGRVVLGLQGETTGIEGSYLFTDEWIGSASAGSASPALEDRFASPFSPIGSEPSDQYDNNLSASMCYFTSLQSAELHATQLVWSGPQGTATVLGGLRFVSIDEELTYSTVNDAFTNDLLIDTTNNMIGPQIGLLSESPLFGGFLNLSLKFGLMNNWFDKTQEFNGVVGTCDDENASALGEFGVEYLYVASPWLAVRVGYQLLGISEVALATDNFENDAALLESGIVKIETDGVLYGIPYLGVTITR